MPPAAPHTDLPTRRLGDSPLQVSSVGLGCNNFGRRLDQERTAAVLEAALTAERRGPGGARPDRPDAAMLSTAGERG